MNCKNCKEEIEETNISRGKTWVHKNDREFFCCVSNQSLKLELELPQYASATPLWTIGYRRMEIVEALNRGMDEFPELKKEMFYWDNKLKCVTTK